MKKTPVRPETNFPKQNIPYRKINKPFRFGFIIPGNGIDIEQDSNGVLYVSSESGMDVADIVAGDNIEITRTEDGKIVVSAVNTVADIAAGQNVSIDIDPETGTAIINSVVDGETNEHYQGVFDTTDELIDYDTNPEEGDYGLVKNVRYSDGGTDSWNGQYKYCFYIGGVWTVVDQMLAFTGNINLIQQYYSVGGSSPVIYLHKVARTGDFNDLRNVPIVATPEASVEGTTVTATCATEGADIWYTTDGTMPGVNATKYTGPLTATGPTNYRFVAVKNGMINSLEAVANADYELQPPTISLNYQTGEVSMENPNVDGIGNPIGSIYYTTDESIPDENSLLYEGPFVITNATNFILIVINTDNSHKSPVAFQSYQKCATPGSHASGKNWITGDSFVRFECATTGAIMHYTIDGPTPDDQSAVCSGRIDGRIYEQQLVKIMAVADGYLPSSVFQYNFGYAKPSAPKITFDSETNLVTLSLTGNASNVNHPKIFYTTDGSTPTINSALYSGPFPVTNGMTVKAVLLAYNQYLSDVATEEITILRMPSATFNSDTGSLTLIDQNTGGVIYYTTDGSTPTAESTQYVSPIVLTEETVVKCISVVENVGQSKVAIYGYEQATQPVITQSNLDLSTGNYQIVMSSDSKWKTIHYTLDGSTPTYQSPVFSNAINKNIFDGQVTVKAIVIYSEQVPSAVVAETYGESAVSAPEITVDNETNKVTIELAGNTANIPLQTNNNVPSMGARIYYTTDGSTPTAESSLYTGNPFTLPEGVTTIKAITVCYGEFNSDVTTEEVGPAPVTGDYMYFEAVEANSIVLLMSQLTTAPDLEYSSDGETWQEWQHTTAEDTHAFDMLTLTAVGDRVYLRGNNPNGLADMQNQKLTIFLMTGKINAGGNIMSLLDKTMVLTDVPVGGFAGLFLDITYGENPNTALLTPPDMSAITSIGFYGCANMYYSCSSLVSAANMPALTTVGDYGCVGMYGVCYSLVSAANMPALTTIGEEGFAGVYQSCTFAMSSDGTTLNFAFPTPPVTVGSATIATDYDIAEWMGNTNGFVTGDYMYFEAAEANSTVSLMSTMAPAPDIEYSTDGETWQEWQHTTAEDTHTFDTLTLTAVGDRVYLRGNNPNGFLDSLFSMTGKIAAHGNAQSLVDRDTPTLVAKIMPLFCDAVLIGQTSDVLVSAPSLPATTLVDSCYSHMFSGCTGLTTAPELPATTLADSCYAGMFSGCTGLTTAPELPATTLVASCYSNMFFECTGLTTAPELPATTLADSCYAGMFLYCTGLTTAPELPARTLADSCYSYMFSGCTGLTTAPELPARTLADSCYYKMFSDCTFDMSSDGHTFNFEFGAIPPETAGEDFFWTEYELAVWMDNTNGFVTP